jgi:hypothetical protein
MIAQLDLVGRMPDGEQRPVRIWLGVPQQEASGEWSCPAGLDGLYDDLAVMRGEDALQAICLALGLCASLLRAHLADGGQLHHSGGEEFPLEAYFGWLGSPLPPA